MNIFCSSPCPIESARNLDDKRVNKLLLEACELLSFHRPELNLRLRRYPHHPITKWVGESPANYTWLYLHLGGLHAEYHFRRGKYHSYLWFYDLLAPTSSVDDSNLAGVTPLKMTRDLTRGLDFRHIEDVYESYRRYLVAKWATDSKPVYFSKRGAPKWHLSYL